VEARRGAVIHRGESPTVVGVRPDLGRVARVSVGPCPEREAAHGNDVGHIVAISDERVERRSGSGSGGTWRTSGTLWPFGPLGPCGTLAAAPAGDLLLDVRDRAVLRVVLVEGLIRLLIGGLRL